MTHQGSLARVVLCSSAWLSLAACSDTSRDGATAPGATGGANEAGGSGGVAGQHADGGNGGGPGGGAGVAGQDVTGSGGGVADAGACVLTSSPDDPTITWSNSVGWRALDYNGPATVETSSQGTLVLYVDSAAAVSTSGTGGGGGATTPPGVRWTIESNRPLPTLPPGTRVWLNEQDDDRAPIVATMPPPRGSQLTVRTRSLGPTILGAASSPTPGNLPVSFQNPIEQCTRLVPDGCYTDQRLTLYSFEVVGDAPVRLRNGETGTIFLGGTPYDVTLSQASRQEGSVVNNRCLDFSGFAAGIWIAATLVPKDPTSVAGDLDTDGGPP